MTSIAVVIPTYGREEILLSTVHQVLQQRPIPNEVFIVDQTPEHKDAVEAALRDLHERKKIIWVRRKVPNGSGARNQGVLRSTAEVILILDDDVLLPTGFVETHLRHFECPSVSAVSGPCLQCAQFSQNLIDRWNPAYGKEELALQFGCESAAQSNDDSIDAFRGGNFSVRRDAYVKCGGFDESFIGAANGHETDFAYRLAKIGRILIDDRCWLVHLKCPSGGCRIPGNSDMPEWMKVVSFFLFAFRYTGRRAGAYKWLYRGLRAGPLRREIFIRPWRWPWSWVSLAYAVYIGTIRAFSNVASPFPRNHTEGMDATG